MGELIAALCGLAGVVVGAWLAGGFRRSPFVPLPYVADTTPPTLSELREDDHE